MWRLLLGTMGVKSLVQGLNAAATAGFEPRTVWSEVRRRNRIVFCVYCIDHVCTVCLPHKFLKNIIALSLLRFPLVCFTVLYGQLSCLNADSEQRTHLRLINNLQQSMFIKRVFHFLVGSSVQLVLTEFNYCIAWIQTQSIVRHGLSWDEGDTNLRKQHIHFTQPTGEDKWIFVQHGCLAVERANSPKCSTLQWVLYKVKLTSFCLSSSFLLHL